ncbi:MAG: hypothetical protein JNG84_13745 [Archangium sp.]|nr:hypothetical protein [Archangium sp.]
MVWDHLFGTYAEETVAPRYGLTVPIESTHPWVVHTVELRRLLASLRAAHGWRERIDLVLRGPEWVPAHARPRSDVAHHAGGWSPGEG